VLWQISGAKMLFCSVNDYERLKSTNFKLNTGLESNAPRQSL